MGLRVKQTKASGAKKGDGDVLTKELPIDICFDGKYVIDPPVNPKFTSKDLQKVRQQAESTGRLGVIVTNTQENIYVAMHLDDFAELLSSTKGD